MSARKLAGVALMASPLVAFLVYLVTIAGWAAVAGMGITAGALGAVMLGSWLVGPL